jgi:G3E family GTPase
MPHGYRTVSAMSPISNPLALTGHLAEQPSGRIPVTLITGFLGAGKSSLINRLIITFRDRRFAIIVNEFGEIPLESRFIEAQKGDIIEFSNGCMCCVARNDLMRSVKLLSRRATGFDHLIVEASGLSDPVPVARSFQQDPDRFSLHAVICVVDAENFSASRGEFPVADTQVEFADFVLITKWRESSVAGRAELEREIRDIHQTVPIVRLDSETSLDLYLDDTGRHARVTEHGHNHRHTGTSHPVPPHCTLSTDRPIDAERFGSFVDALPSNIIRGKGVVYFSGKDGRRFKALLQIVGARRNLEVVRWKRSEPKRTDLLFIGEGLDPDELAQRFRTICGIPA